MNSWNKIIETGVYTKPWSSFDGIPILRIEIPRYKISQIVMKNTSAQNLAFGPAWHSESYLPKDNKVTIISGHRDSHFIYIKNLEIGDIIKIQDKENNWYTYIVENFFIVNSLKEEILMNQNEKKLLIITCYPFNEIHSGTPYRYIISAKEHIIYVFSY